MQRYDEILKLPNYFAKKNKKGAEVPGTIAPHYMRMPIDKWKDNGGSVREIVLMEFLKKFLL